MPNHHMRAVCPLCSGIKDDRAILCRGCWNSSGKARRGTGRYLDMVRDGYVLVYFPKHPRTDKDGYVKRAILVWEQVNRGLVPQGKHIHHKDGVRDNDIPSNLEMITSSEHCSITQPWRFRR